MIKHKKEPIYYVKDVYSEMMGGGTILTFIKLTDRKVVVIGDGAITINKNMKEFNEASSEGPLAYVEAHGIDNKP